MGSKCRRDQTFCVKAERPPHPERVACNHDGLLRIAVVILSASYSGLGATGHGGYDRLDVPGGGVPAEGSGCGASRCLGCLCVLPQEAACPDAPPHCEQCQTNRLGDNLQIISVSSAALSLEVSSAAAEAGRAPGDGRFLCGIGLRSPPLLPIAGKRRHQGGDIETTAEAAESFF